MITNHTEPVIDAEECRACDGEGYRYIPQVGRHRLHPVNEVRCEPCQGTGLIVTDPNQMELW